MPQPSAQFTPPAFRRILFASNFTSASAAALPYAAAFAHRFGGEILAVHIVSPDEEAHLEPDLRSATLDALRDSTENRIRRLLHLADGSDVTFRVLIETGEIAEVLASIIESQHIDLVVAGSEGRHGIQKLLSPPVDEEIAVSAHCPVLLVGPDTAPPASPGALISRILHPTDFNPRSTPVVAHGYALAQWFSAQLFVLHIADDVWKEPLSTRMTAEGFCRMRLLENSLPEHSSALDPTFLVEFGPPEQMILETASRIDADLILMGVPSSAHPSLVSHFPGPLAYDIASHARCPVLVMRNAQGPAETAQTRIPESTGPDMP